MLELESFSGDFLKIDFRVQNSDFAIHLEYMITQNKQFVNRKCEKIVNLCIIDNINSFLQ